MESLGEYLRRQRELKGISLKEISDKTKIGINYLRYIEEDQFDKIPGEVFAKGFLKLYANSIGLQEEGILEKYNTRYKKEEKKDNDQRVIKKRHIKLPSWLWAIPILILSILLFKGLPQKGGRSPLPPKEITKEVGTLATPQESHIPPKSLPEKLNLSIEAVEETWIKILIDGKEVKEMLLKSGDRVSFEAEKNFGLTVGNAGGVKISFNGKELESLGPSGMVIRNLVLSRDKSETSKALP